MADPNFGQPGRIDILHGVDVYIEALVHSWQVAEPDAPVAFETEFGWVLAGNTCASPSQSTTQVATHHIVSTDDMIWKFWETEESPTGKMALTLEENFIEESFQR